MLPEPPQGDNIDGFASFPLQSAAFVGLGVSVAFWCATCAGGQDSMTSCIRGSNVCCVLCAVCCVLGVGCRVPGGSCVVRGAWCVLRGRLWVVSCALWCVSFSHFFEFVPTFGPDSFTTRLQRCMQRGTKWVTQIPAAVKMSVQLGRRLHADFHKSAGGLGIVNTPAVRP